MTVVSSFDIFAEGADNDTPEVIERLGQGILSGVIP